MYIGLDLSLTETGVAAITDDGLTAEVVKPPKGRNGVYRLEYLEKRIMRAVEQHGDVTGLAVEGYSMNSKGRVFDIAELGGIMKLAIRKAKIPAVIVPPKTLKKYVTGNGNADKKIMISVVSKHWYKTTNDNEADAVGLAHFAKAYFTGAGGLQSFTDLQKKCTRIPIS